MARTTIDLAAALRAGMRDNLYLMLVGAFGIVCPGNRFERADYVEAICRALQDVAEGETSRLIISVAPRHLKSICASVLLPAFLLGRDPTCKIMVVSYGGDLAREHAETFRRLVDSALYRTLFPKTRLDPRSNRVDHVKTTRGGGRMATSLGGAVTGFGADVIILDDLIKAGDANYAVAREQVRVLFDQVIYSRLNDKQRGAIVSVAQRLHADDITAYLLEKETFRHVVLPSIAQSPIDLPLYSGQRFRRKVGEVLNAKREPQEVLDRIREEIGNYAFAAQYLQDPRPGASDYIRMEDLHLVDAMPPADTLLRRVQSWDTAAKDGARSAYSVGMTFGWCHGDNRWYLLDVYRDRPDYSTLKDRVLGLRDRWKAEVVLIEDTAMGSALLRDLPRGRRFKSVTANEGKLERFLPVTDWLRRGRLVIPATTPWFDNFRRELLTFPNDTYADQVDALVQFMHWEVRHRRTFLDKDPETGRRLGLYRPSARSRAYTL